MNVIKIYAVCVKSSGFSPQLFPIETTNTAFGYVELIRFIISWNFAQIIGNNKRGSYAVVC